MLNNQSTKGFLTFIVLINIFFISYFSVHISSRLLSTSASSYSLVVNDVNIEQIDEDAVKIQWKTDRKDVNQLIYSSNDENVCTTLTKLDEKCFLRKTNQYTNNHEIILTGLNKNERYYFFIKTSNDLLFPQGEPYTFVFN